VINCAQASLFCPSMISDMHSASSGMSHDGDIVCVVDVDGSLDDVRAADGGHCRCHRTQVL